MPYQIILHVPNNPKQYRELCQTIAQFRAEKALKYPAPPGKTGDPATVLPERAPDLPAKLCDRETHSK